MRCIPGPLDAQEASNSVLQTSSNQSLCDITGNDWRCSLACPRSIPLLKVNLTQLRLHKHCMIAILYSYDCVLHVPSKYMLGNYPTSIPTCGTTLKHHPFHIFKKDGKTRKQRSRETKMAVFMYI